MLTYSDSSSIMLCIEYLYVYFFHFFLHFFVFLFYSLLVFLFFFFFFQAEDGIRDGHVTGVQTCALPICFCRDVIQPNCLEALNADDTQVRVARCSLAGDIELARYGRADGMEETQMLPETSGDRHKVDRLSPFVGVVLDSEGKPKEPQAAADPTDDLRVR